MDVDDKKEAPKAVAEAETKAEEAPLTPAQALAAAASLVVRAVQGKEAFTMQRALRATVVARRAGHLTKEHVGAFAAASVPEGAPIKAALDKALPKGDASMEGGNEGGKGAGAGGDAGAAPAAPLPESEAYATLCGVMALLDGGDVEGARALAMAAVGWLQASVNRRTMDVLSARLYFYYSLAHEKLGRLAEIRPTLLALHRSATVRHDGPGAEMLLNLLLRNYLHFSLYDQAEKLRSQAQAVAGEQGSGQQLCRYLYYLGRVRAVALEYSEAKDCLQQALRKGPQSGALGFRAACNKWLLVVQLLLGEVPERSTFRQQGLQNALAPYYDLAAAVRDGDVKAFEAAAARHADVFRRDRLHNLVVRLHRTVLRTGLRNLNLAYSRISIADAAAKLGLGSADAADAEFIVAKVIRDGGIEATIDRATGTIVSKEVAGVYETAEPQAAFHSRVAFCLNLHNDAVKAMRYPQDAYKAKLEKLEHHRFDDDDIVELDDDDMFDM